MLAACTTTFTACNSDESSLPTAGNQLQLSFGINAPESRAKLSGNEFPINSKVGVILDDGENTDYDGFNKLHYTYTQSGESKVWNGSETVYLTPTKGTLYAYYPYSEEVDITNIEVDVTDGKQTDWMYATPVANINKSKSEVAVTMNHMLGNINVTVTQGTYVGEGNISEISIQGKGIAANGIFNAAKEIPEFTSIEGKNVRISQNVSMNPRDTGVDFMFVPTNVNEVVTFTVTVDGTTYYAQTEAIHLQAGYDYYYSLTLNSTSLGISSFSMKPWITQDNGSLDVVGSLWNLVDSGVYAVSADGKPVMVDDADESCIAVALVVNEVVDKEGQPIPQKFMIAKKGPKLSNNSETFHWGQSIMGKDVEDIVNYSIIDSNENEYLDGELNTWTVGASSDFSGKENTTAILASYNEYGVQMGSNDMCSVLKSFNTNEAAANRPSDWYIPALGQLGLIVFNKYDINVALEKIGGNKLNDVWFWSSSEKDSDKAWSIYFGTKKVSAQSKYLAGSNGNWLRFIRDI